MRTKNGAGFTVEFFPMTRLLFVEIFIHLFSEYTTDDINNGEFEEYKYYRNIYEII